MYLKHANQPVEDLHQRIFSHLVEQQEQFAARIYDPGFPNGQHGVSSELVLDGCSVLVLEISDRFVDPEEELKISTDKLVRVHQDLLILDNQIPFIVLRLLCNDEARLKKCLIKRRSLHLRKCRIGTIRELKAIGIRVRKDPNNNSFYPSFNDGSGLLQLPKLTVDGSTARFVDIRDRIHSHFESKRGKIKMLGWMGEAYNTYFRSPWTIIALLAASPGLVLTFMQT